MMLEAIKAIGYGVLGGIIGMSIITKRYDILASTILGSLLGIGVALNM